MDRTHSASDNEQSAVLDEAGGAGGTRRSPGAYELNGEVSGEIVRAQCLGKGAAGREVKFIGKRITGPVNLSEETVSLSPRFINCMFTDPVDLTGVRAAASIYLEGCENVSLRADRLSVRGDLVLENVRDGGSISLCGAQLTGHLRCTGSAFSDPIGRVFNARGMHVEGSALFDGGFRSVGEVVLAAARVEGSVDMTGASFSNARGLALNARGIRVGTGLLLTKAMAKGTVELTEAHVWGEASFSGGDFRAPTAKPDAPAIDAQRIRADDIYMEGPFRAEGQVRLDGAIVTGGVICVGGEFCNPAKIALSANGLDCREARLGHGLTATGEVQLIGATIARELNCTNGKFSNGNGDALKADGLACGGKVYMNERFVAYGGVIFNSTRITTELNCTGGTFRNENDDGTALAANGLICDGKVYLNRSPIGHFHAIGKVELANAQIKIQLNCTGGAFENHGHTALDAGGLTCGDTVYLNDGFRACGKVSLVDAAVGRELSCDGGIFEELEATGLRVGVKFDWRPAECPVEVDISFAKVGLLLDKPGSWPNGGTKLLGLTLQDIDSQYWPTSQQPTGWLAGHVVRIRRKESIAMQRIDWLEDAEYAPDVYQQLVGIYRQKGRGKAATEIAVAGQRARRTRGGMPWPSRIWNRLIGFSVCYGHKMYRPLLLMLVFVAVSVAFFYWAKTHNIMEAVGGAHGAAADANKCTAHYPCFFPPTYAFEIFLPVINLRQVNFWLPSGETRLGTALLIWVWFAIAYGWLATATIIAGIGHLYSQQD